MPTILVADDSTTIRKVVQSGLGSAGYAVLTAGNGREALRIARECRPDLVLCDVLMPELTGYEVSEALRADPATRGTPVLLLFGAFEPFDEARAARSGAAGFLAKPFEPRQLLRRIEESLAAGPGAGRREPAPPVEAETEAADPIGLEPPPVSSGHHPTPTELSPVLSGGSAPEARWMDPVPLPGDEAFGFSPPAATRAPRARPGLDPALREEVRRELAEIAPGIVREIAWEILPDLLERLVREAAAARPVDEPRGDADR